MTGKPVKICVFGAGAIGTFIAGRLASVPGVQVSVVARGAQLAAISQNGITIESLKGAVGVRVTATDDTATLGVQDYVFLTLKSHQVTPSLQQIRTLMNGDTAVIPPTTGIPFWYFHQLSGHAPRAIERLDPGGQQWAALPGHQVLGAVYWLACEVVSPGVVRHDGSFLNIPVGEPDGSVSSRLRLLSEMMIKAGINAPAVANIRSWIWIKMISSLSWNPVAVLTGATLGELNARPQIVAIVRRMMEEADAVAACLGAVPPMSIEERIATARAAPDHKMSMLQDVERGRPLEVEALIGSIEAMRDISGLPTPTIDDIYALLMLRLDSMGTGKEGQECRVH